MWKVEIVRVYKSSNLLYEHEDKVIFEVSGRRMKERVNTWMIRFRLWMMQWQH